jgi:acetyltransferase-like isoleucine patch superfamily enzyme
MKSILKLFLKEYIANHIIPVIPVSAIRLKFYQLVLNINIGQKSNILMNVYIYNGSETFSIGNNTTINRECILDRRGGLRIGSFVSISPRAQIYTAGHNINSDNFESLKRNVIIGDFVWIGSNSVIQPGVELGDGVVVLPGSVVTKSFPGNAIVGGVPACILSFRKSSLNPETYQSSWAPWFQ